MGPTCVGKTSLSLELLENFPFEIISVDSSMVYRYMNIGTGKPSLRYLMKYKHYLINIRDPVEKYSIFDFCNDSFTIMKSCWERKRVPLFVGGTMMYFWVLQRNLDFYKKTRQSVMDYIYYEYNLYGLKFLYEKIKFLDKKSALHFDYNDKFSILKCLKKIYYSAFFFNLESYNFLNIAIIPVNKSNLFCKIKKRLYDMLSLNFIDEVVFLRSRGDLNLKHQSTKAIGYKDIWLFLDNKVSFEYAKKSIIKSTMDLSNRQMMWLKKWKNTLIYLENNDKNLFKKISHVVNNFLNLRGCNVWK